MMSRLIGGCPARAVVARACADGRAQRTLEVPDADGAPARVIALADR